MNIPRRKYKELIELLNQFPAVALLGPRQVGKTTLARELAANGPITYLDLESPMDLARLAEPELYFRNHENNLVILDEIHRVPQLFNTLRGIIDDGRRRGLKNNRFLLLGSASIDLLKQSGESLAGRIAFLELAPFDCSEVDQQSQDVLWLRGGFPDSFLARNDSESFTWRENFIRTYLERDIPQFGPRIPSERLRRFWTMLANLQGELLNASTMARGLGVNSKTIANYVDLLVDLLLVRRLPAWHGNAGKRIVKSPRLYIRDSGLVHTLLGLGTMHDLLGHPVIGKSWEGFVIENIIMASPSRSEAYFYRSSGGAEIDLVLAMPGKGTWAIEIKRSLSPKPRRGFHHACEDIQPDQQFVVYPGRDSFPVSDAVTAISLSEFLSSLK